MMVLLTAVLLGIGFTFLAIQNTAGVDLRAGNYFLTDVPLFLVVMGSFFFGLFLSWILSSIGWVSSAMTVRGKNSTIKDKNQEIHTLRKRINELEEKNENVEGDKKEIIHARNEHDHEKHPSFLERLRYRLS